jgi:hypothetical protein
MSVTDDGIGVGHAVEYATTVSADDVSRFAAAGGRTDQSGDERERTAVTMSTESVATELLAGWLISSALSRLPGAPVSLSRDLSFYRSTRVGCRLAAECEVVENLGNGRFRLRTRVVNGADVVADGESVILLEDAQVA